MIAMIYNSTQHNLEHKSPVQSIVQTCRKYGLIDAVFKAIETGQYMKKLKWKTLVKFVISNRDHMRLTITCKLYKSLHRIRHERRNTISSWWIFSKDCPRYLKKCKHIIRLLTTPAIFESDTCKRCGNYETRTYEHVFFVCETLSVKRDELWSNFLHTCPGHLASEIEEMPHSAKTNFVLNGMNNSYVEKWQESYKALADFVSNLWHHYTT